ncbi:MAG TPA: sigma 54-interacting transcriptional regulator [Candidatus Acidoferrum sp.]|nr:sigma 54-interacting transcriptional regulator [Candidatus Acidoferrum sp.]
MATKLLAISGPLRKAEFPVSTSVTIGRNAGNTVRLEDSAVSPHHCVIESQHGKAVLTDLESHFGTFVNGIPVKDRELKSGDQIAVGNSVFLFQTEKVHSVASSPVQISAQEPLNLKVLQFRPQELLNLDATSLAALPQPARVARNLNTLLPISRALSSLRDEAALPWQILAMIFDVIPAERGAVLITEDGSPDIRSHVTWDRINGPDHSVPISQEIMRRAIEEKVSLLDSGPAIENFADPAAAKPSELRTRLCVPMLSNEKVIGVIYLESTSSTTALSEDDFQLLSAIAGLLVIGIENARQLERLGSENQRLHAEVSLSHDMVGRSPRMRDIYQFIKRVAPSDSTVLICGESGTGKELAARAIHNNSPRKTQPFVALNCAALSETLLESELFGHEKGAFTSAIAQKKGFLEVAEGGTIFLDEIGELSPILQAKLLRVLQEREFMRVGGTRPIKIDVRFLAATNKDLQKNAREQSFRPDLFHRLNVISMTLPPLREHPEDIPALAEHFAARYAKHCNRNVTAISHEAMTLLTQYHWPGNIRELENAMERAVVVGSSDRILAEDLPESVLETAKTGCGSPANYHDAICNLKKQLIVSALDQSHGNVTDAATLLGVHANYLHRLMRNFQLRPDQKKHTDN